MMMIRRKICSDNDNIDDGDNIQVGVRHILDVEEQDWLLREDVAKGYYTQSQNQKYTFKYTKYAIPKSKMHF